MERAIFEEIEDKGYAVRSLEDFSDYLWDIDDGVVKTQELQSLAAELEEKGLASHPRIHSGAIERSINAVIVLYEGSESLVDLNSRDFTRARLLARVGAIMARIDRRIDDSELNAIGNLLEGFTKLDERQKNYLKAYAAYLAHANVGYHERTRAFVRISLDKEHVLDVIQERTPAAQQVILDAAVAVALADQTLHHLEYDFLKDLFRQIHGEARSARKYIENFSKKNFMPINAETQRYDPQTDHSEEDIDEAADVLDEMLADLEF
jgi:tellurite resistance protein